jgi:hypothetical protein
MSTVDEYHKYARDCHRWAARARTEEQQKQFLSLAHDCYTSRIANGGGLEEIMKSRTNFAHRIDMWNDDGATIVEHLAGIDDCELAMAAYQFAVQRWPKAAITLRQGARVIKDSRKRRMPSQ